MCTFHKERIREICKEFSLDASTQRLLFQKPSCTSGNQTTGVMLDFHLVLNPREQQCHSGENVRRADLLNQTTGPPSPAFSSHSAQPGIPRKPTNRMTPMASSYPCSPATDLRRHVASGTGKIRYPLQQVAIGSPSSTNLPSPLSKPSKLVALTASCSSEFHKLTIRCVKYFLASVLNLPPFSFSGQPWVVPSILGEEKILLPVTPHTMHNFIDIHHVSLYLPFF